MSGISQNKEKVLSSSKLFSLLNFNNLFAAMEVGEMVGSGACLVFNSVVGLNAGKLLISEKNKLCLLKRGALQRKRELCRNNG